MITLHGFGPNVGLADASPFVLKVDAYLRMAGIPFESDNGISNFRKAPKGKLPFISDNGTLISDSTFITKYLQQTHATNPDDHLTAEQRSIGFLVGSTLEEKLYWCILYFRWVDDAGWDLTKSNFFSSMAAPLKLFVPAIVRRNTCNTAKKQGIARHSPEEVLDIARDSLASIATTIGDGPFLFGDSPCSTDATLYGFLAQLTLANIRTPVNDIADEYPNLNTYCEHFTERYY